MLKKSQKIFLFCLSLILLLNSAVAILPLSETEEENPIPELYQEVSQEYMSETIENILKLLESFVFSDILKSPPSPYNENKVDVSKLFENIEIGTNRPFYEFYRGVKLALSNLIDANFDVTGGDIPLENGTIHFQNYRMCLPFKFYVDYNDKNESAMFIKEYPTCSKYYDNETIEIIKEHEGEPISDINGKDPFEYIQNFGNDIYKFKNPEAQFSIIIDSIHDNYLGFTPLSLEQLNKFEISFNGSGFGTKFHIIKEEEAEEASPNDVPNADVTWDFQSADGKLKCRVDKDKGLNVLFLKKLTIEDQFEDEVLMNCTKLIYSNDNKIVIITSQLWEGEDYTSYAFAQLLFPKTNIKFNMAMKQTKMNEQLFNSNYKGLFSDPKSCEPFERWEDLIEPKPIDYDGVNHSRTKIFNPIPDVVAFEMNYNVLALLYETMHYKKATDIVILTDTVNFGPASNFIKTIQSNGAAILASYAGNPYSNKSKNQTLDASLDPVFSTKYVGTEEYNTLKKNGFEIFAVPFAEMYEKREGDKYPMAFVVNKVDEETKIYHAYDDAYYDEFIGEAKNILDKYETECNKDNMNLVYETNHTFDDDEHAHGGNQCGSDGKWSSKPKKTYCDFGYFYDKPADACLRDNCINEENQIILNGEKNETITIKQGNNTRYVFRVNATDYAYLFTSNIPGYMHYSPKNPCPSTICALQRGISGHSNKIYINYNSMQLPMDLEIKIISVPIKNNDLLIQSLKIESFNQVNLNSNINKIIIITQTSDDMIYYFQTFDESSKIYCAEFTSLMTAYDVVNINPKHFKLLGNKVILPEKDKIYIFAFVTEIPYSPLLFVFQPRVINKVSKVEINRPFIYLANDSEPYTLDFSSNNNDIVLQLARATKNSEISIENLATGDTAVLNSSNAYFTFENQNSTFRGNLSIKVTKGKGALIEVLYATQDYEFITEKELNGYKITKPLIIKFDEYTKDKYINFELKEANGKPFKYNFLTYYSINNYTALPIDYIALIESSNNKLTIYNKQEELEQDESFCLLIFIDKQLLNDTNYTITITKTEDPNPIPELYKEVTPEYMKSVITDISTLFDSFVYSDIIKSPPAPYDGYKKDVLAEIAKIDTSENRPFYEFYRDIKITYSNFRDANLDIIGGYVPLGNRRVYFVDYMYCLPFEFYVDKDNTTGQVQMFIKENPPCSKYYDYSLINYIKEHENKTLVKINDKDPFDFITNFGTDYYKFKNPNAHFNIVIKSISYNDLSWTPLSIEELSKIKLEFTEGNPLDTHFHIIQTPYLEAEEAEGREEEEEEEEESGIQWDKASKGGEIKCRVDEENKVNVILINSLYIEPTLNTTLYECASLIHSNNYSVVIITNQLWEGISQNSYRYAQLLFPNIDIKFNMAMKQTELNKKFFEDNKNQFLDAETCSPFETWKDLTNNYEDDYGEGVRHNRTKIFNPITKEMLYKTTQERKELVELGNNKKSTEIVILTDSVNFGPASNFIKAIQNNGGAIVATYGGNPNLTADKFKDVSIDPMFSTIYQDSEEFERLDENGFEVYNIPYAEMFQNVRVDKYPMAFRVNKADEETQIYHAYDDAYYKEFIDEATNILVKYKTECNKDNKNLISETNDTFEGDEHAHGGYECGSDGKWDTTKPKISYCDIGYYKEDDKCVFDFCSHVEYSPIIELYQEVTPEYMSEAIGYLKTLFDSYVFSDIMKNPPSPYNDSEFDITEKLANITINESRPFYEFYRDIKQAYAPYRDANLDILGGTIKFEGNNYIFRDYWMCLPFQFYLDYEKNTDVKMYIKEFPDCSKYYDESVITFIKENSNMPVSAINGTDPFDFIQGFSKEFYQMKNRHSQFNNILANFHNNELVYQPLTPAQLNYIKIELNQTKTLETHFHMIKPDPFDLKKDINVNVKSENESDSISWNITSESGEIKCRVDVVNQINVLVIRALYSEGFYSDLLLDCVGLFYSNEYKLVIITDQLWTGENMGGFVFAQILFPKIDIKFNYAMKQTDLNRQLFENDKKEFLDSKTCRPYLTWEEFIEPNPVDYGDGVTHNRTKTFDPINADRALVRKEILSKGHSKKSTDVLILTDSVNFGPASSAIKTIQNNGGAIVATYAGNPRLEDAIKDVSLDPAFMTKYDKGDMVGKKLEDMGFEIYGIPFAEQFENVDGDDYPMAFVVNKADEETKIYHAYDDAYYKEFIDEAKNILEKYTTECNKDNMNLVLETDHIFVDDIHAHGGLKCGSDGKWSSETKKTYCDVEYYYDKKEDKCLLDYCYIPINELYQRVSPQYMKEVIDNLKILFDSYVFSDIIKNPPSPYDNLQFNIAEKLDNITINESRPFYEFYRDIKQSYAPFSDANLDILGGEVPLGDEKVKFKDYWMCLPFKFYLDYGNNTDVKMYIKEFPECSQYYDNETKSFIKDHSNQAVTYINGKEPFDFVQSFSNEFYKLKNPDAQFNNIFDNIHYNTLVFQPLTPEQLSSFIVKFEDNTELKTHFHIRIENTNNKETNTLSEDRNDITWTISTDKFKCRVDNDKKINVIVINSFILDENEKINEVEILYSCSELFHSNDNKLVIIMKQLWEGEEISGYQYSQLLFPKIDIRFNLAMKQTDLNRQYFENNKKEFLNINTCMAYQTWDDFIEQKADDYGEGVTHKRTKLFSKIPENKIHEMREKRENLLKKEHTKISTDILILTDSVNFGPASNFIKTIQNNGGAIVATYAGNPKGDKNKPRDASMDPVFMTYYENMEPSKKLKDLGFELFGIPLAELFENQNSRYPMAFVVNKADEETDIYHAYDDDYYEEFIDKAKEILDKYNDTKCNKNNKNIVYEKGKCSFDDEYAHGGYECGENGEWNDTCKISYCEINYYYDKVQNKCVADYCVDNPDQKVIQLEGEYNTTITMEIGNNTRFLFNVKSNGDYLYFFKADKPGYMQYEVDIPCPSDICILQKNGGNHYDRMYINYYQNISDENVTFEIFTVKNFKGLAQSLIAVDLQRILGNPEKLLLISQSKEDYIYMFKVFDDSSKMYCAEYKSEMTVDDIMHINTAYFEEYKNNAIIETEAEKTYIFISTTSKPNSLLEMASQKKAGDTNIKIGDYITFFMYFIKDQTYTINFSNNKYDSMIHLLKTSDNEITITKGGKTSKLNSSNPYYSFDEANSILKAPYKGEIQLTVSKGDNASIELLYAPDTSVYTVLEEKEYDKNEISKSAIVSFAKNTKDKNINITIASKSEKNFGYSSFQIYTKNNYITVPVDIPNDGQMVTGSNSYTITINNKNENLVEGETLTLVLYFEKDVGSILLTKIEEKTPEPPHTDPTTDPNPTDEGESDELPGWAIALIVIAAVLVVGAIVLIIWRCVLAKDHVDSEAIGSLVTQSNSNEMGEARD